MNQACAQLFCLRVANELNSIAVTEFRAPHVLYATEQERQALRLNLLLLGNKCAAFCEALDVLNDIHIIFLYQTFQFQSVLYGDQSVPPSRDCAPNDVRLKI